MYVESVVGRRIENHDTEGSQELASATSGFGKCLNYLGSHVIVLSSIPRQLCPPASFFHHCQLDPFIESAQLSLLTTRPRSRAILLVGRGSLLLPHDGGLGFLGAGKFGAGLVVLLFLYRPNSQRTRHPEKKGKGARGGEGREYLT